MVVWAEERNVERGKPFYISQRKDHTKHLSYCDRENPGEMTNQMIGCRRILVAGSTRLYTFGPLVVFSRWIRQRNRGRFPTERRRACVG